MDDTRILIVEDEALFSQLLSQTLSNEPGLEVVGMAQDGETALRLVEKTEPDAVLMDIELDGEMDGVETALRIKKDRPSTGIVILSSHKDRRYVTTLPLGQSPGWSYLLKQTVADVGAIVRAIQGSIAGMLVLDPAVVASLQPRSGSTISRLAPRQREVLELIAQGYNNAAIAQRMTLAEKSVETYISAIYQHLDLTGEQELHARVKATLLYIEET